MPTASGTTAPVSAAHKRVLQALASHYPDAICELNHRNPFELLVATILSAQCTDKRVNIVTPMLFAAYPTAHAMAAAERTAIEELVRTTGFFRAKANNILSMATRLVTHHGGNVPSTMAELLALPGVARKTANVVLGVGFGLSEGVVVDTHVLRLSKRLDFTAADDPKKVERDLMELVPRSGWIDISHRLIAHGRAVCKAQRPWCGACPMHTLCPALAAGHVAPGAPKAAPPSKP